MSSSPVDLRTALQLQREADRQWSAAVRAGAGPIARLRQLADAAEAEANALRLVNASGLPWEPKPGASKRGLSYEFSPASDPRPGPATLWERLDQTVAALGRALEGDSMPLVARAFEDLSYAARDLANRVNDAAAAAESATQ